MVDPKGEKPPRKKRVGKQDWLDAALDLLKKSGIEAVRVERLAEKLGVAKSGFYYHFRDREGLLAQLLQHWVSVDHLPILEDRQLVKEPPEKRLLAIAEAVDRANLSRYDLAIRQWARTDQKVRRVWRAEMDKRLQIIRGLFSELGYSDDDLEMRVRLFVGYHVSERELFSELNSAERERLRMLRLALILSPSATAE